MFASVQKERMALRVSPELKMLAEQASAVKGTSVTNYIVDLIQRDAPEVLQRQATITVTNAQFDAFMMACQDKALAPSSRILEAARQLDQEGF